jgi:hypothetical protein
VLLAHELWAVTPPGAAADEECWAAALNAALAASREEAKTIWSHLHRRRTFRLAPRGQSYPRWAVTRSRRYVFSGLSTEIYVYPHIIFAVGRPSRPDIMRARISAIMGEAETT